MLITKNARPYELGCDLVDLVPRVSLGNLSDARGLHLHFTQSQATACAVPFTPLGRSPPPCGVHYSYASPFPPHSTLRTVSTHWSRTRVPCRAAPARLRSPHPRLLPVASCFLFWFSYPSTFVSHTMHLLIGELPHPL